MNEYYLTEEDYKIAESNGISERLAKFRYEQCAWEKERAITQAPRVTENLWPAYKETAKKNGVAQSTFYGRMYRGWDVDRAASTPPVDPKEGGRRKAYKRVQIPEEIYELAKKNGIRRTTVWQRIQRYGFSFEEAATTPIIKGRRNRDYDNFFRPIGKS